MGASIAREAGARVLELPAAHGKGPAIVAAGPALIEPFVELLREAGAIFALRPRLPKSTIPAACASDFGAGCQTKA